MPIISRFFGLTITMYFDDHGPPHFHARAAGRVRTGVWPGESQAA